MAEWDLIIIGGGPGGYVSAIRAAQLKLKVAVIEKENMGGVCLNWGCIPTKALLRSAEVLRLAQTGANYGVVAKDVAPDLPGMVKRSRQVAGQLSGGVGFLMKKNKVEVIMGEASLAGGKVGDRQVKVKTNDGEKTMTAKNIILAMGARPKELPNFKTDGKQIWHYRHALNPPQKPESMIILGSGAIGIEFASFYHDIGVKVTVVEILPKILPQEDDEISMMAEQIMTKQGIQFRTNCAAESVVKTDKGVELTIKNKEGKQEKLQAQVLLSAVGITPNTDMAGLDKTAIKLDRGFVTTDAWAETAEKGIYAIGDIGAPPWLAHKAEHEGVIAVEKIAGVKGIHPLNKQNIPACTYCHPQIASVGMTEKMAKEKGHQIKVGKFPFQGNGKAIANGDAVGMIKTIFDGKTGELLGAHMIGSEVVELIHSMTISRTLETTEAELIHTIFPHPTLSEMLHESVMAAHMRAIHI